MLKGGQFGIFLLVTLYAKKYSVELPFYMCTILNGGTSILIDQVMGQKQIHFIF